MLTLTQILTRLLISAILSGLIGLEREFKHKPAGLRTNILVGIGSTLIMLISLQLGNWGPADPGRIAAGVITGIGFLCAGLIIRGDKEDIIHGITTAATIWVVAAVGLAVGAGFYLEALIATMISLVVLFVFGSDILRDKVKSKF